MPARKLTLAWWRHSFRAGELAGVRGRRCESCGPRPSQSGNCGQANWRFDLLIAGQALRHQVTLITANGREFGRVKGLEWEDWAKG